MGVGAGAGLSAWLVFAIALALVIPHPMAAAQPAPPPAQLTGTLAKAHDKGVLAIGYRDSSIPFSYVSAHGQPIGYSVDLCKLVVDAVSEAVGRPVAITWVPVTSASRIGAVVSGQVDLECGSTTNNLERQKQVAFSPTLFVSGTKLMVKKGSPVKTFRDLPGKRVVVTAGTTNEKAMRDLAQRFKLDLSIVVAPDHAASFAMLAAGQVDAFATDDVLLYGLLAQNNAQADYVVTGDFLSYEPYGVMYRRDDPQLARVVNDSFHELAENGEIERRYERWFLRKLPSGVSLNLAMSPQLQTLIDTMVSRSE
jgi:ABC-type amino acid transport substrate-binding protein